jgi:hypothetical protein
MQNAELSAGSHVRGTLSSIAENQQNSNCNPPRHMCVRGGRCQGALCVCVGGLSRCKGCDVRPEEVGHLAYVLEVDGWVVEAAPPRLRETRGAAEA